jgi:Tol biopolymer transport system component
MLRRPLLVAALLALLAFGAQQSSGASPGVRNGRIAYAHVGNGNRFQIYTVTATGAHRRHLTSGRRYSSYGPAYAPRGRRIAFARAGAAPDIWTMNADGTHKRALPRTTGEQEVDPAWSPPSELSSLLGASDLEPAWSPDGSRILFVSDRPDQTQLDLWVMNANGSDAQRVTNTPSRDERDPAWSPDGRRIVYSGNGSFHGASSSQIYVSKANGTDRRILTHACGECAYLNEDPSWQPLP